MKYRYNYNPPTNVESTILSAANQLIPASENAKDYKFVDNSIKGQVCRLVVLIYYDLTRLAYVELVEGTKALANEFEVTSFKTYSRRHRFLQRAVYKP